jgi:hypothetical protein
MTKMQIVLTSDDLDFLVVALNDASLEIAEKQEEKQEEMYDRITTELRGLHQALQSSRVVFTASGEPKVGDDPTQLH